VEKKAWVIGAEFGRSFLGLVSKCSELAAEKNLELSVFCIWNQLETPQITAIRQAGGMHINHLPLSGLDLNAEHAACTVLAEYAGKEQPDFIIFESSVFACAVAPALSSKINCGITADCTDFYWSPTGRLQQVRPTFGGRRLAVIENVRGTTIATACKGVFPMKQAVTETTETVEVTKLEVPAVDLLWDFRKCLTNVEQSADLMGADVILAGGLGVGTRENFQKIVRLAEIFHAGVGASRAAVAAGFATYDHQVGQSGITVRPKLYVAFGISGAVQHLSGMLAAETICAVNNDPRAPIHDYSDYSIVADCNQVLDMLLKRYS